MTTSDRIRDLRQALNVASSDEQADVCKVYNILTAAERRQLRHPPKERQKLIQCIMQARDKYLAYIQTLRIRGQGDILGFRLRELHHLSEQLDQITHQHALRYDTLECLRQLRNEWKHNGSDIERILVSIISSTMTRQDFRLIQADPSHLTTLGLGLRSLHKRYLVFEPTAEPQTVLLEIIEDFGQVFASNAAQNLARIEEQLPGQMQRSLAEIETFYRCLYDVHDPDEHHNGEERNLEANAGQAPVGPDPRQRPVTEEATTATMNMTATRTTMPTIPMMPATAGAAAAETSPWTSSGVTPPGVGGGGGGVQPPTFEPASCDWPNLIKLKYPARHVWALLKRRLFRRNNADSTLRVSSLTRLSHHLQRCGYNYYTNLLEHAQLMYTRESHALVQATESLVKCHHALQIEIGHTNLQRALVHLDQLQEDEGTTSSSMDILDV
ncbi:hypothetical protein EC973_000503 [Apophysomyces ossiformis]|uniref:Uncharacterized protein n=1 Tax=Apophysomyces ossiformis TaxID=679940 RepID=A0A8H7BRK3_9FUNG|nr:hypothetical protein EC973_000503 [Apophysomyces ossiformis]